jgi:hypothetical protein
MPSRARDLDHYLDQNRVESAGNVRIRTLVLWGCGA